MFQWKSKTSEESFTIIIALRRETLKRKTLLLMRIPFLGSRTSYLQFITNITKWKSPLSTNTSIKTSIQSSNFSSFSSLSSRNMLFISWTNASFRQQSSMLKMKIKNWYRKYFSKQKMITLLWLLRDFLESKDYPNQSFLNIKLK